MTDIGAYPYGTTPPVVGNRFTNSPAWNGWDTLPDNEWVKVDTFNRSDDAIEPLLNALTWAGSRRWQGTVKGSFVAWVGAAVDQEGGNCYIPWGGGHADSSLNGIWKLDLEAMEWSIESNPSDPDAPGYEWSDAYWDSGSYTSYQPKDPDNLYGADILPDRMPTSRHQYGGVWFDSTRRTLNQSRNSAWSYNIDTKVTERRVWRDGNGDPIYPWYPNGLCYDAVTDRVVGGFQRSSGDYFFNGDINPDTLVYTSLGAPITCQYSSYTIHDRTLYQVSGSGGTEDWAEYDLDTDTWTSGPTTGITWSYNWLSDMQAFAYVPEWGLILRQFTGNDHTGEWWVYDPVTKNNTRYVGAGDIPTFDAWIGTKCFYYPNRNAVIYVASSGVWVMKCAAGM